MDRDFDGRLSFEEFMGEVTEMQSGNTEMQSENTEMQNRCNCILQKCDRNANTGEFSTLQKYRLGGEAFMGE